MKATTTRNPLLLLITIGLAGLGCTLAGQLPGGEPTPRAGVTRMTDSLIGPLRLADGCLRIGEGEGSHVVVWPPDFEVSMEGDLMWVFYDDHEVEVQLGQAVSLMGGEVKSMGAFDEATRQQVPAGCEGPYWLAGSISPAGAIWAEITGGLAGSHWLLLFMNGEKLIQGTEITLTFGAEYLSGTMTCNSYGGGRDGGAYRATKDGRLTIPEPLAVTAQLCSEPEGVMEQEAAYIEALHGASAFRVVLDALQIADDVGKSTLVFKRRE